MPSSMIMAIGAVLCLCWLMPSMVKSTLISPPLSSLEEEEIVAAHNWHRTQVKPFAGNMQKVYWSAELAELAAEDAQLCDPASVNMAPSHSHKYYSKSSFVGENTGVSLSRNITTLIWYWFSEGQSYNFYKKACFPKGPYTYTCQHYLQMVWSKTCEVGCAIAECPNLNVSSYYENFLSTYGHYYDVELNDTTFLVICNYGPGYTDEIAHRSRPYWKGYPCTKCPYEYPLCDRTNYGYGYAQYTGLCHNEEEMCMGSDPHFAIRLPGGQLLCYTFQGAHNTTFNLVSNRELEMNALFVPDQTNWDNTWLGAIGMTILHDGKKMTTLEFTAHDQIVKIKGKIPFHASQLKRLTFRKNKLTILETPKGHHPTSPRVLVQFLDSDLNFTVGFTKRGHLDLYWHSTGTPYEGSNGIVGQLFRQGVTLDEEARLLHIHGHPPIPVEQQDLWKFMEQSFPRDSTCWTMSYHTSQGAGVLEGSYEDYIVDRLLTVGQ